VPEGTDLVVIAKVGADELSLESLRREWGHVARLLRKHAGAPRSSSGSSAPSRTGAPGNIMAPAHGAAPMPRTKPTRAPK
jgi:hypothetical protein